MHNSQAHFVRVLLLSLVTPSIPIWLHDVLFTRSEENGTNRAYITTTMNRTRETSYIVWYVDDHDCFKGASFQLLTEACQTQIEKKTPAAGPRLKTQKSLAQSVATPLQINAEGKGRNRAHCMPRRCHLPIPHDDKHGQHSWRGKIDARKQLGRGNEATVLKTRFCHSPRCESRQK